VKCLLQSSIQAAILYYQSNHSKVEAIPLSALPKDTTSELADAFIDASKAFDCINHALLFNKLKHQSVAYLLALFGCSSTGIQSKS